MEGYRRKTRDTAHREVCGVHHRKQRIEVGEILALVNQGERGGILRDLRGVKGRNRNENVFARPSGLRENDKTAISCRGPGPARKKEVYR